jgi:hypothetical protein
MGHEQSVLIDYSVNDIDVEKMFVSFHVGYIGEIYYGNGDNRYERDFVYKVASDFIRNAQDENTKLKVMYKSYIDSFTKSVRKEILILEHESQEKMTRNIICNSNSGTAIKLHVLKNYIYGVFFYEGKLVAKISFS